MARKRLAAIGWTKLSLIAKYVDPDSIGEWLKITEEKTADELRAHLAGKEGPINTMALKLTNAQYSVVAGTLLANGAYLTAGAGIANKEAALVKICLTLRRAWAAGIT